MAAPIVLSALPCGKCLNYGFLLTFYACRVPAALMLISTLVHELSNGNLGRKIHTKARLKHENNL